MRPLVMDFRTDVRAENTGDEFMYGPAFLVAGLMPLLATVALLLLVRSPT